MPNIKAAKKAMRQSKRNKAKNEGVKRFFKTALKTAKKSVAEGGTETKEKLRLAQKALDKAAKMDVIKKNTASRLFSRLMKQANKVAKK